MAMDIKYLIHWGVFVFFLAIISRYDTYFNWYSICLFGITLILMDYLLSKASVKVSLLNRRIRLPVSVGVIAVGAVLARNLV